MIGGAVMTETTPDELLRQADALVVRALSETQARCAVLGHYISEGSRTAGWSEAVRELRALHDYRTGLLHKHSLIQQALDYPADECPTKVPLTPPANRAVGRTQRQVQIRARRRS